MTVLDEPQSDRDLVDRATSILRDRLPRDWTLSGGQKTHLPSGSEGVLQVRAPVGRTVNLLVEARRTVERRDVPALTARVQGFVEERTADVGLVVARYLSPPVRELLARDEIAYVDATGNVRLSLSTPDLGLFVMDRGGDNDPWRGRGRPPGTLKGLKGAPAARVVRALVDIDTPWRTTELVSAAGVSTGAAYRVLDFLEEENLIVRKGSQVLVDDWQALLRRWSRDYEFARNNVTTRWIAPRGLDRLLERMIGYPETRYAVTGTLAAAKWFAYAPARSAMIYAAYPKQAAAAWDLRPAEAGANVVIAEPADDVVFARTSTATNGQYAVAAPAQVAVDLLTGPGRNPAEGEELIEWMTSNESVWRRQP